MEAIWLLAAKSAKARVVIKFWGTHGGSSSPHAGSAAASNSAGGSIPALSCAASGQGAWERVLVRPGILGFSLGGPVSLGLCSYARRIGLQCLEPLESGQLRHGPVSLGSVSQAVFQLHSTDRAQEAADLHMPFSSSPGQAGSKAGLKTDLLEGSVARAGFDKADIGKAFGWSYNISGRSGRREGVHGAYHKASHLDMASSGAGESKGCIDTGVAASSSSLDRTDPAKIPATWNVVGFEELELAKAVGEGSFGQVYLAKYCHTIVAVKVLSQAKAVTPTSSSVQQSTLENLLKEIRIMSSLRHPNVTQYLGVCLDPPCLLMEYCSRKSVDAILQAAHDNPLLARQLTWARLLHVAIDAAKGMLYLHSRHPAIVHRDLKSANLLVDSHWHVKVADFNLSRPMEVKAATSTLVITNPRWLAPEVLQGGQANLASDVWAFGTVMWELMTWQLPFAHMNPFQIFMQVTQDKEGSGLVIPPPDALPAGPLPCYDQYVALMKACHSRDPAQRPTMDQVVTALLPLMGAESQSRRSSVCREREQSRPEQQHSTIGAEPQSWRSGMCLQRQESRAEQSCFSFCFATVEARLEGQSSAFLSSEGARADLQSSLHLPADEATRVERAEGWSGSGLQSQGHEGFITLTAPAALSTHDFLSAAPLAFPFGQQGAAELLLAAGYVTVANAGLSQMNSGIRGYPFINSGYFGILHMELVE
ncbi:hypothetical protein N2152v2_002846 [Parachlorella kessleri]